MATMNTAVKSLTRRQLGLQGLALKAGSNLVQAMDTERNHERFPKILTRLWDMAQPSAANFRKAAINSITTHSAELLAADSFKAYMSTGPKMTADLMTDLAAFAGRVNTAEDLAEAAQAKVVARTREVTHYLVNWISGSQQTSNKDRFEDMLAQWQWKDSQDQNQN